MRSLGVVVLVVLIMSLLSVVSSYDEDDMRESNLNEHDEDHRAGKEHEVEVDISVQDHTPSNGHHARHHPGHHLADHDYDDEHDAYDDEHHHDDHELSHDEMVDMLHDDDFLH